MFTNWLEFRFASVVAKIAFSRDGSIPEAGVAVIENEALTQALLESIIGEHGVSPAAKQSVAMRLSEYLSKAGDVQEKKPQVEQPVVAWILSEREKKALKQEHCAFAVVQSLERGMLSWATKS